MTILDSSNELLYDKSRETELMDILGVESMDEVSIIPWRSPETPPREGSYVFVKYSVPLLRQVHVDMFEYEDGAFIYSPNGRRRYQLPIGEVLGWAYPISHCM